MQYKERGAEMDSEMIKKEIMIGTWAWGTGMNGSSMVFGKKQDPSVLKKSFDKAVECGFLS